MPLTLRNVTFSSNDPGRLADFWAAVLNYPERRETPDEVIIAPADWRFPRFTFQRVASPHSGRGRVHVDLTADDMHTEIDRLLGLGAERSPDIGTVTSDDVTWTVLHDPDGNELCVVQHSATD